MCSAKDFGNKGLKISESDKIEYNKRLCPDITPEAEKIYQIMHPYTQRTKRISFAIMIFKCQVDPGVQECAPDD